MNGDTFRALVITSEGDSAIDEHVLASRLPDGDVEVAVASSSLNYKDALAVTGRGKVVRSYPMVPGIDLAGIVTNSSSPAWRVGDRVIATGAGLGEERWGGYAERARVDSRWLVRLPEKLDLQSSMALGTAGLTAMLSLMACEEHGLRPSEHPVVVTGASGGLGSLAVAILARSGYSVVASTGRLEHRDYLQQLGAVDVIDRDMLSAASDKPLERGRWTAAVDSVGGATLAGLLRSMRPGGTVASCGMAGGHELATTVFPFILRGVALLGIDSVWCALARRETAWRRLSDIVDGIPLDQVARVATVDDVPMLSNQILDGQIRGRVVIDVHGDHAADQ